jgi:hypothetical protein
MVDHVVFVPGAPLMLPECDRADDLGPLRAEAVATLSRALAAGVDGIVIIGPGPFDAHFGPGAVGTTHGLGLDGSYPLDPQIAPDGTVMPLSLTVGASLLAATGWSGSLTAVAVAAGEAVRPWTASRLPLTAASGSTLLLVVGDGAATRGEKSPGYLNDDAEPFDALVTAALADADVDALLGIPAQRAADVLADGLPAWQLAATVVEAAGGTWIGRVMAESVPFGVCYRVAAWRRVRE